MRFWQRFALSQSAAISLVKLRKNGVFSDDDNEKVLVNEDKSEKKGVFSDDDNEKVLVNEEKFEKKAFSPMRITKKCS